MALSYSIKAKNVSGAQAQVIVDVTIGAAGDYSNGLTLNAASCGVSRIQHVIPFGQGSATTGAYWFYDLSNDKVRAYKTGSALSGLLTEAAGADVSGDVLRCLVIGDQVNKG